MFQLTIQKTKQNKKTRPLIGFKYERIILL